MKTVVGCWSLATKSSVVGLRSSAETCGDQDCSKSQVLSFRPEFDHRKDGRTQWRNLLFCEERMTKFLNDQSGFDRLSAHHELAKSRMPRSIRDAHEHSSKHRSEVLASEVCACFYCGGTFAPSEINDWADSGQTALCPKCGIDSVIGSTAGFPLTKEFLDEMHKYWF
jgi:hypothetical protein